MKNIRNWSVLLMSFLFSLTLLSCSSNGNNIDDSTNDNGEGTTQIITPSNLTLSVDIVGATNNNPYGAGSGVVNFTASATNAVTYGFIIDNQAEQKISNGALQFIFDATVGVENHDVKVIAYSSTDDSVETSQTFPVAFYSGQSPVWADEFFENGAPNPLNWNYDLGDGGWGNSELQTYTNTTDNVSVENGVLKITAKSDGAGGYTSARIKSENLFEFTYGTVEVRAKLPAAQGTWPAIWMLGANFSTVSWPTCGEIDIMEQKGTDKNKVLGTCHWSNNGNYAGYGLDTTIDNSSDSFHVYKLVWTAESIRIFVDNTQYFVMTTNSSMPFNKDFFFIFNIAMGGNLGGTIDPSFTQDTMEIDYIRVYQ